MYKIAICDDDRIFCATIEKLIVEYEKKVTEKFDVAVFYSGESLYEYMVSLEVFDLIFLDIELVTVSGVEIGKLIRKNLMDEQVNIVYVSSHERYAMELFKIRPLDFLIKPVFDDDLTDVIEKGLILSERYGRMFTYKIGHEYYKKSLREIYYFRCVNREIFMVSGTECVKYYQSLEKVYELVKDYGFFYIHKSYIVNYAKIQEFSFNKVLLTNGETLSVSQGKRKEVKQIQIEWERQRI